MVSVKKHPPRKRDVVRCNPGLVIKTHLVIKGTDSKYRIAKWLKQEVNSLSTWVRIPFHNVPCIRKKQQRREVSCWSILRMKQMQH